MVLNIQLHTVRKHRTKLQFPQTQAKQMEVWQVLMTTRLMPWYLRLFMSVHSKSYIYFIFQADVAKDNHSCDINNISHALKRVNFDMESVQLRRSARHNKTNDTIEFVSQDTQQFDADRNIHSNVNARKKILNANLSLSEKINRDTPNKQFIIGEVILATVSGYCPWPGKILDIIGETVYVQFFGTGEMYVALN